MQIDFDAGKFAGNYHLEKKPKIGEMNHAF